MSFLKIDSLYFRAKNQSKNTKDYISSTRFFAELRTGLNSRIYFKNDWFDLFNSINAKAREKSDLDKGANMVYYGIFMAILSSQVNLEVDSHITNKQADMVSI
ncbi:MAG: hypothetical protein RMJ38_01190 [candidate division WOR-3 bacterium]|nr:hypothetical protein [candidate division WOR-3 bacterium]MDW8150042.1 hypothetical protein [candidate division WOR-3 bacterium]